MRQLPRQCIKRDCDKNSVRSELCRKHYQEKYCAVRPISQVYAILAGSIQYPKVKFGIATRPKRRLNELQTGSPVSLTMLGHIPGARKLEAAIHAHLGEYHSHGEWYAYAGEAKRIAKFIVDGRLGEVQAAVMPIEKLSFENKLAAIAVT